MNDDSHHPESPSEKPVPSGRELKKDGSSSEFFDLSEIDLLDIFNHVWAERKLILIITLVFFGIGVFHYLYGPVEYESEAILIQESDDAGGGNFRTGSDLFQMFAGGDMRSTAGISAAARGQSPPPLFLYPSIVQSSSFQEELINKEIDFQNLGMSITLVEYFTEYQETAFRHRVYNFVQDYTIKLPFTIFDWLKRGVRGLRGLVSSGSGSSSQPEEITELVQDDRLLSLSREEMRVISNMRNRISVEIGQGLTTVKTRLPDPKAAAMVNVLVVERIQEYMTNYRIEKARQNLEFIQQNLELARERYEEAQLELARFDDENVNLRSAVARTQREHLSNKRDLRFNVYNSLSEQEEQAKLTLQKETPIFNILEKPNIPTSPDTTASNLVVIFSIVLGLFTGVMWVLVRDIYYKIKRR